MAKAQKDVAYRLELTREALGKSKAEIADESGIARNAWVQYTTVDTKDARRITVDQVHKLQDEYGITFDWVYSGRRVGMPDELMNRVREIEREGGLVLVDHQWVRAVRKTG